MSYIKKEGKEMCKLADLMADLSVGRLSSLITLSILAFSFIQGNVKLARFRQL